MTVDYWLRTATIYLQSRGITTARLDCLVLLEDALRIPRAKLLAEPETEMKGGQVDQLKKLLNRRAQHEPLAYIRGRSEFYGRDFKVGPGVLVPRPESETIIELLLSLPDLQREQNSEKVQQREWKIADIGTGSGALGITAAKELPYCQVELIDIDESALEIAKTNVVLHTAPVLVTTSNLLMKTQQQNDILICNLPYVPDDYEINKAAEHEPSIALFGGKDGLDLYRSLFDQIDTNPFKPLYLLTEALPASHSAMAALAKDFGYRLEKLQDFVQLFVHDNR